MRAKSNPSNGKRSKAKKPAAPKRRSPSETKTKTDFFGQPKKDSAGESVKETTTKMARKANDELDWRKSKEVAYVLNLFLDAYRGM